MPLPSFAFTGWDAGGGPATASIHAGSCDGAAFAEVRSIVGDWSVAADWPSAGAASGSASGGAAAGPTESGVASGRSVGHGAPAPTRWLEGGDRAAAHGPHDRHDGGEYDADQDRLTQPGSGHEGEL